ncbi:alpha/beta fold hydrolase [Micromonospora sp. FIMYZ51]|uniref:thioesterase II family protein n=1 Tax=Micromonospora sp. FIMYZ51 TaxID=3051832 RepID=UPI00311F2D8C
MTNTQTDRWLRTFGAPVPSESPVRLLCLPHAGGSASFYAPLAEALRGRMSVAALQYPGRQDRFGEPCPDSIQELADAAVAALGETVQRPFALFGHSMGGVVAYEMAARLQAAGQSPTALFVSGTAGPLASRDMGTHLLADEPFSNELVRLGATDRELLTGEMRDVVLPMIRADYRAIETYRCTRPHTLACPLTALVGRDDPYVTRQEAARWRVHTTGGFTMRVFPGGHFYLQERFDRVAAAIGAEIGASASAGS